jgi:hypothetical protein
MPQHILRIQVSENSMTESLLLTEAPFTEKSVSIFQSSRAPSGVGKVITEKFQHHGLLFMPCRLLP